MTVKELENKFSNLLKSEIKGIPKKVRTLFDIAGFPHYETVSSNFYAYYLNPLENHGFGDLFLSALSSIITAKNGGQIIIESPTLCVVNREVYTEQGKYIDIVISEFEKSNTLPVNAIIIENKLFADLYNDLEEYYRHIKVSGRTIGIVLSIRREISLPKGFINITHQELITTIEQFSGQYFPAASEKQLMIFKEFIQNIKTMAYQNDLSEQFDFYFNHQEQIIEISSLYSALIEEVYMQASLACEKLGLGLELRASSNKLLRYYVSPKSSVYFTIWLPELMNGEGYLTIMVELDSEGMKYLDQINKIEFTEDERKYIKETTRVRKTYLHYASKSFRPSVTQVKNLSDFICSEILQTPFKTVFLKIETLLSTLQAKEER